MQQSQGDEALRVSVHISLREIKEHEWDALVPPGMGFQRYRMLLFLEERGLTDWPPRYFCFRNADGELVAHAAAYFIRTSLAIFSSPTVRRAIDRIRDVWPAFLNPLTLECGWPISPGSPVCVRPDVARVDVLARLAEAADAEAGRCNVKIIVIRDFLDDQLEEASGLADRAYTRIPNLPTAVLRIRWQSFDDYLAAMRSRHRAKVRRGLAIAASNGLSARTCHSFCGMGAGLVREWRNVHEHATEYAREELTAQFYDGFEKAADGHGRLVEILRDGRRIAHALILIDGGILRWLFFGRDCAEDRDGAYFLVIAEVVKMAIRDRLDIVEMGLTTYSPKTDFGAQMVALWVFVRFRGRTLGRLLPPLIKLLNPIPETTQREVFRAEDDLRLQQGAATCGG